MAFLRLSPVMTTTAMSQPHRPDMSVSFIRTCTGNMCSKDACPSQQTTTCTMLGVSWKTIHEIINMPYQDSRLLEQHMQRHLL